MNLKEEINLYIAQHGMWKSRLLDSLEKRSSEFDPEAVKTDNQCAFGKWLYNSISSDLKASNLYEEVRAAHADFHRETARILRLIMDGKMDEAKRSLEMDTVYAAISSKLTLLMMQWKRSM
jgi:hypothetical protein